MSLKKHNGTQQSNEWKKNGTERCDNQKKSATT